MDENLKKEIQSATLERLIKHLDERKGITISDPDARERIYGMPYPEWKEKYQK